LRIYFAAQNLFTLSNYSGYDPEVSIKDSALTPGLDFSAYPRARSFSFGINLGF
jgi:putative outer membrane protein